MVAMAFKGNPHAARPVGYKQSYPGFTLFAEHPFAAPFNESQSIANGRCIYITAEIIWAHYLILETTLKRNTEPFVVSGLRMDTKK